MPNVRSTPSRSDPRPAVYTWRKTRIALRWLAAAGFTAAGIKHFTNADFYQRIIPPGFPNPPLLVAVSGACEIAGGLGLLVRPVRRAAGWGLIALLIAVFPANIFMAVAPHRIPGMHIARWMLWARLPLQPLMIAWVWFVALRRDGGSLHSDLEYRGRSTAAPSARSGRP
ncbi:MAG TPA: DoxX family membrane protein [Tepidisphaeraceae bacterium]|nr:DoxX family membrane protein [Tepidisphaeraceae bacterium]